MASAENGSLALLDYAIMWKLLLQHRALRNKAFVTSQKLLMLPYSYPMPFSWYWSVASKQVRMILHVHQNIRLAEFKGSMYKELELCHAATAATALST